jgi:hypothetical protein
MVTSTGLPRTAPPWKGIWVVLWGAVTNSPLELPDELEPEFEPLDEPPPLELLLPPNELLPLLPLDEPPLLDPPDWMPVKTQSFDWQLKLVQQSADEAQALPVDPHTPLSTSPSVWPQAPTARGAARSAAQSNAGGRKERTFMSHVRITRASGLANRRARRSRQGGKAMR